MSKLQHIELWNNAAGAQTQLEDNDGARTFFCPSDARVGGPFGTADNPMGESVTTDTHSVDEFVGGPGLRREHIFPIDLSMGGNEYADYLTVEFNGSVVSSSGYGDSGMGASYPRTFWDADLRVVAYGSASGERPHVIQFTTTDGKMATMAGLTSGNASESELWCGNHALMAMSNRSSDSDNDIIDHTPPYNAASLPYGSVQTSMSKSGLFWGYSESNSVPTNLSRYPQAGDRCGFMFRVGLTDQAAYWNGAINATPQGARYSNLRVTGLKKVFLAVHFTRSLGGTPYWVSYSSASHVVAGKMVAILSSL